MRIIVYAMLLLIALAWPTRGTDVGKLRPVEVVAVAQTGGEYTLRTDTGDWGRGASLQEAYEDLKTAAPGVIYLDTAEYLLQETPVDQMNVLKNLLKPSVRVCAAKQGIELEGSGKYLDNHHPKTRLKDGAAYQSLEILWEQDGKYRLE